MGKTIEDLAKQAGHTVSHIIDQDNTEEIRLITPENTDVAIEFTQPESAYDNITTLLKNKVKTLSGTTGWLAKYPEVAKACEENHGTFLYASNFSLGVNLFFALNEWLATKMGKLGTFQPVVKEIHHTEKKDAPSGTAITIAEGIQENIPAISGWVNHLSSSKNKLGIISLREPGVPGTHTVTYQSEFETIEIKHIAHDRKIFAEGVIKVAEWVTNQTGMLSIKDYLKHQL